MDNNPTLDDSKITYEQFGRQKAESSQGNSNALRGYLNIIYNEIVKKATLDENQKSQKLRALNDERTTIETKIILKNTEIQTKDVEKKGKQKELDDIAHGNGHVELVPFVMVTLITVLLTFFLWIFYSGTSYGAINEKVFTEEGYGNGMSGIFSSLGYWIQFGSGIEKAFYGLFPIIFIGLGFLIHDGLSKKKYLQIAILLLFTFAVDALIGYKISENLYKTDKIIQMDIPWQPNFIFKDPNFYLILVCGFASYVIWGFLLNTAFEKYNAMQPSIRQQHLLRDIGNIEIAIAKLRGEKESFENKKNEITQEIQDTGKNVVYISVNNLKALIGHFMSGWGGWIQFMRSDEAIGLITVSNEIQEKWLSETLEESNKSVVFKQ